MILVLRAVIVLSLVPMAGVLSAQPPSRGARTIADRVANLRKLDGFVPPLLGRSERPVAARDRAAFEVRAGAREALRLARGKLTARTDAAGLLCDRRSIGT